MLIVAAVAETHLARLRMNELTEQAPPLRLLLALAQLPVWPLELHFWQQSTILCLRESPANVLR